MQHYFLKVDAYILLSYLYISSAICFKPNSEKEPPTPRGTTRQSVCAYSLSNNRMIHEDLFHQYFQLHTVSAI